MTARLIRLKEVMYLTGLSRATIYRYMRDGIFPLSLSLGGGAIAWSEQEICSWIAGKIEKGIQSKNNPRSTISHNHSLNPQGTCPKNNSLHHVSLGCLAA